MDVESRFAELVRRAGPAVPLDEAALCIAAAGREPNGAAAPAINVDEQLHRLDMLALECPSATADGVCELLFSKLGLRGAEVDYDDPRHSFLDQVLDRRLGIPISLAVLAIEIGRRVGVPLEGVGMPGHFLVGDPARQDSYIDVYHRGVRLDAQECRALFERGFGPGAAWSPHFLSAVSTHSILVRMLANLTGSYRSRRDSYGRLWVARFRAAIPGRPVAERIEIAEELAQAGAFGLAASLLEDVVGVRDRRGDSSGPRDPKGERLREQARGWRARLN